ncbi:MAG: tyrosine-type recombinase/integrase, partial [Myxococcales bacterium]|nr:tyrosine-type recombinase/integrase [Myxococcales bacterium]
MKITLRPYANNKSRWQVDIRLMNPCKPDTEIRKRKVAPAGLSKTQARAWGERQVAAILREVLGDDAGRERKAPETTNTPDTRTTALAVVPDPPRDATTLAEFYRARFEPEHVRVQKPSTQASYEKVFRIDIAPLLGDVPLGQLDEDRLSMFRAKLAARLGPTSVNLVLAKVAKILRFAKRVRMIVAVPEVEKMRKPKPRPKPIYSDAQIEALLAGARTISPECALICLLALDAGLRTSEICALHWGDLDLEAGTMIVQHNHYQGELITPKGGIGKLALTAALRAALVEHRRREPIGPLVLYRMSSRTGGEWVPHTPPSLRYQLNLAQAAAGLERSGLHLLRHTSLTRLANLGASLYVIQAVARHTSLQTTQAYIHTHRGGLAREAAALLD